MSGGVIRAAGRERRSREVAGGGRGGDGVRGERQRHRRSERVVQGMMEEVMRAMSNSSSGVSYMCVFLLYKYVLHRCIPDGRSEA